MRAHERIVNTTARTAGTMKVHSRFLSHLRLDQSYSLLSGRDISISLEFFKALDIRGEMALDGMAHLHT